MIRVDIRAACDTCGGDVHSLNTYVLPPATDKQASAQAQSLAMLVHKVIWGAVQKGASVTPHSLRCKGCSPPRAHQQTEGRPA